MNQPPIFNANDFLFEPTSPASFRSAMGTDASGAVVVRFDDADDHFGNRERAAALLSSLGRLVCVYPADGLWSDLTVRLSADPQRTHGVGENPFHMDLVDREGAPRYIALYCERADPAGGGASRLADVWAAVRELSLEDRRVLEIPAFSYFSDDGVHGVGVPLERFAIIPGAVSPGVPIRFTSKMLPHLRRAELVAPEVLSPYEAAEAFERLVLAVQAHSTEHTLQPGEMLVFDQYRWAHARAALGVNQTAIPEDGRRLLKQTYVGVDR